MGENLYKHGDIIGIHNEKTDKVFPCVVVRYAYNDDRKYVVCMRTNSPDAIKFYEPDISMEFSIGDRRKGFILTSPIYVPEEEVVSKNGSLNPDQIAEFNEMLMRSMGIIGEVPEVDYREKYMKLKEDLRQLAG